METVVFKYIKTKKHNRNTHQRMATPQKQLESSIEQYINLQGKEAKEELQSSTITQLSSRVDMPKHFIAELSKHLNPKVTEKVSRAVELLNAAMQNYDNKVALFNQICQKEFLFKVSLVLKNMPRQLETDRICHQKLVDMVFGWYSRFKGNRDMFNNFWSFYNGFEKMGFQSSTGEQVFQTNLSVAQKQKKSSVRSNESSLLDFEDAVNEVKFQAIQSGTLREFQDLVNKIVQANKIISNTDPSIMDFPPFIKEKMAEIKIAEAKLNKIAEENQSRDAFSIAMLLSQNVQITQKRYSQLISRYMPPKFELPEVVSKLQSYCLQKLGSQTASTSNKLNLLDLGQEQGASKKQQSKDLDLLDMQEDQNSEPQKPRSQVNSFFGSLLDGQQKRQTQQMQMNQISLSSDKPIESDFKTDMDFKGYSDPKPMMEKLTDLSDFKAADLFKR